MIMDVPSDLHTERPRLPEVEYCTLVAGEFSSSFSPNPVHNSRTRARKEQCFFPHLQDSPEFTSQLLFALQNLPFRPASESHLRMSPNHSTQ